MWNRHFTDVLIEIWIQPSNMYCFLDLLSNLRVILVNNGEIINGGQEGGGGPYSVLRLLMC